MEAGAIEGAFGDADGTGFFEKGFGGNWAVFEGFLQEITGKIELRLGEKEVGGLGCGGELGSTEERGMGSGSQARVAVGVREKARAWVRGERLVLRGMSDGAGIADSRDCNCRLGGLG